MCLTCICSSLILNALNQALNIMEHNLEINKRPFRLGLFGLECFEYEVHHLFFSFLSLLHQIKPIK